MHLPGREAAPGRWEHVRDRSVGPVEADKRTSLGAVQELFSTD
jgi:hypothetical protein